MRFDVVHPLELPAVDEAAWTQLQGADPVLQSPFLSPKWARACAEMRGPDHRGARVVIARGDDGQGVGFLPIRLSRPAARPLGAPLCDYQAMVSTPGLMVDPRAMVRALGVQRLDFSHMLESQANFHPFMRGDGASQVIDLTGGYAAYAEERRAGGHDILKDTAKKGRKLERERGAPVFTAASDAVADFEALIAWKRQQYRATRQTDIFEAGWPLELLKDLFLRRDDDFRALLFTLHVDGALAAAHLALRNGPVLHAWFIAHDAEFAKYSPGVILIDHILRWSSDHGVRELDLGPGDYRFKLQLANTVRRVAHGFVGTPSPATLVRAAQYGVRTAAESLPLGRLSAWPGKAMRRVDLWNGLR